MNKLSIRILLALAVGGAILCPTASGAPQKEAVAAGFPDFTGATDKNYVFGRTVSPSSLRHRVVAIIEVDSDKLAENIASIGPLAFDGMPPVKGTDWDSLDKMPREVVWVVSIKNNRADAASYRAALKPAKSAAAHEDEKESKKDAKKESKKDAKSGEAEPASVSALDAATIASWSGQSAAPAVYNDLSLVGFDTPGSYPYAYVLDGKSAEPVFKDKLSNETLGAFTAAIEKAKNALDTFEPLVGVDEVKYFKKAEKNIKSGLPPSASLGMLKAGIKDKDAEKATEAQIMYDAIYQTRDDLVCRIMREYQSAPARAFVDLQRLVKAFPAEKKKLLAVDIALKKNKEAASLGKIFEKYCEWSRPGFTFKSAADAKKAGVQVVAWKKQLDKIAQNQQNPALAAEAALIATQIDSFAESLASKVPQK